MPAFLSPFFLSPPSLLLEYSCTALVMAHYIWPTATIKCERMLEAALEDAVERAFWICEYYSYGVAVYLSISISAQNPISADVHAHRKNGYTELADLEVEKP